jgi:uncharacterized membrane protein (DUF2068 family)
MLLAAGAASYCIVRFVEAYGLFRGAAWAEVVAALSGAIYVPFELAALLHKATYLDVAVLATNVVVLAVVVRALLHRHQRRPENPA